MQNGAAAAALTGAWTQTVDRAALLKTHAPDYDANPGGTRLDVGRYRLVLMHGHAALSKQNRISTFHSSGTFSVRGDTIASRWKTAVEHDLGRPVDHFPCCDPPWRLRWSLYRGVLTLQRVPSQLEVPPAMTAAAWRRA